MDSLTQGILGATAAQVFSSPPLNRKAAVIGFVAGLSADLDVLIRSSRDPLLGLVYHRHFTHSLFFIPFGALLVSLFLYAFFKKTLSFKQIYFFSFLGYATHALLDACTSYGTHLFWPFTDARTAWHCVSIIDPLYTIPLGIMSFLSFKRKLASPAKVGLIVSCFYLFFGLYQRNAVTQIAQDTLESHGHHAEKLLVTPSLGNNILWRIVYLHQGSFYSFAVRRNFYGQVAVYEGEQIEAMDFQSPAWGAVASTTVGKDILRFREFTSDWVGVENEPNLALTDARYSALPFSLTPLWKITWDPGNLQKHVHYQINRELRKEKLKTFMDLLLDR